MGNGGCSQYITHWFCHSFLLRWRTLHTLHLLWCGAHPIGDSSSYKNFCNMSLLHRVHFLINSPVRVPSTICSPSGTAVPTQVPHRVTNPARNLLQHRLPTGSQTPSGVHMFWCEVLQGLQVDPSSTMNGCRGTACLVMVFTMGLCGKIHIARCLCPETRQKCPVTLFMNKGHKEFLHGVSQIVGGHSLIFSPIFLAT